MTEQITRQEALYILAGAPMRPEPEHALALCELAKEDDENTEEMKMASPQPQQEDVREFYRREQRRRRWTILWRIWAALIFAGYGWFGWKLYQVWPMVAVCAGITLLAIAGLIVMLLRAAKEAQRERQRECSYDRYRRGSDG